MINQEKVNDIDELLDMDHLKKQPDVEKLICKASWLFEGQIDDLYMAIGALVVGRLFGWRILRLTLTSKQYARYQRILSLGLDEPGDFHFNKWMRDKDRLSYKSIGLQLVEKVGDFWAAAKGLISELPLSKRRDVKLDHSAL